MNEHIPYKTCLMKFLESKITNMWINHPDISIYVRKGWHRLPDFRMPVETFDIANINVPQTMQKQGIFTRWLEMAEDVANEEGFAAVFVESVLNPDLAKFLAKRGYTQSGPDECPNFFRYCQN